MEWIICFNFNLAYKKIEKLIKFCRNHIQRTNLLLVFFRILAQNLPYLTETYINGLDCILIEKLIKFFYPNNFKDAPLIILI